MPAPGSASTASDQTDPGAALRRAFGYPYAAPWQSWQFRDGQVEAFDPGRRNDRIPVLAIGSNRAPEQLARKYADLPGTLIPVERVFLQDFDVVYAATLARYGAVPAMLQHVPGCRVELMLTWLTEAQLARMHATELGAANYNFARLEQLQLETETSEVHTSAFCYIGARGAFADDAAEAYALQQVPAEGRRLPQADTRAMLARFARLFDWPGDVESFTLTAIRDESRRRAWVAALAAHAKPFDYPWTALS